jgi:hypothetical protein
MRHSGCILELLKPESSATFRKKCAPKILTPIQREQNHVKIQIEWENAQGKHLVVANHHNPPC